MSILPYEKFELRTALNQQEILERMTVNRLYKGIATSNEFNVQRAITYRNSFLPQIKGTITEDSRGANIQITMKLPIAVIAFMSIWLVIILAFCILSLTAIDLSDDSSSIFQYAPFLMVFFGLAIAIVPFKVESKISKKDLLGILQAEVVPLDKYK